MKKTSMCILPALVAAFALAFVVATPYVMAESGYGIHSYHDGVKSHKAHWAIPVQGFVGSIQITEDVDKKTLKEQVTVSLSEASAGLDVQKAGLGVAVNENGEKYIVWKLVSFNKDSESGTVIINIVDAGDADNTTSVTKEFDKSSHHDKWAHYKGMSGHYADLTPEEREAKFVQFKEMKQAFEALSEDDQTALKSYFNDMKGQFADSTPEEREAKHAEFKQQMEAFMGLTLDEKINYLKNLAMASRNQA